MYHIGRPSSTCVRIRQDHDISRKHIWRWRIVVKDVDFRNVLICLVKRAITTGQIARRSDGNKHTSPHAPRSTKRARRRSRSCTHRQKSKSKARPSKSTRSGNASPDHNIPGRCTGRVEANLLPRTDETAEVDKSNAQSKPEIKHGVVTAHGHSFDWFHYALLVCSKHSNHSTRVICHRIPKRTPNPYPRKRRRHLRRRQRSRTGEPRRSSRIRRQHLRRAQNNTQHQLAIRAPADGAPKPRAGRRAAGLVEPQEEAEETRGQGPPGERLRELPH
jgi:hypothetical protein